MDLTPGELHHYTTLFKQCDIKGNGLITAEVAVPFLSRSNLSQETLGKIWMLSDKETKGFLDFNSFKRCLKLIACAQNNLPVLESSILSSTPLPVFHASLGSVDWLTQQDKERFTGFFEQLQPKNGLVAGEKARDLLLKSQLPVETLSAVWRLVDTSGSGSLSLSQFIIAMALVTKLKLGVISLPTSIPFELAKAAGQSDVDSNRLSSPVIKNIPLDGPNPEDIEKYQGYFRNLDTSKKGFLTGAESYEFFVRSKLPSDDLRRIWEYVDDKKTGSINKDGFVMAMHLIRSRMEGKPLPQKEIPQTTITSPPLIPIEMDLLGEPIESPAKNADSVKGIVPIPTSLTNSPSSKSNTVNLTAIPASSAKSRMSSFEPSGIISTPASSSLPVGVAPLPGTSAAASLPSFVHQSSFNSIEIKAIAERQVDLNSRKDEVKALVEQLEKLKPSSSELLEKREKIEKEYKEASENRNKLTIELSQKRALYESDYASLQDTQSSLARELEILKALQDELGQYNQALQAIKNERDAATEMQATNQRQVTELKKSIKEVTDETNELRVKLEQVRSDLKQQLQLVDVNKKLLESAQNEYKHVKSDLLEEQQRLDMETKRAQQLRQQANVQNEINRKEKEKLVQAEHQKKFEISKSQEFLNQVNNRNGTAPLSEPIAQPKNEVKAEVTTNGSTSSLLSSSQPKTEVTVVLPNTVAPPAPSVMSKPRSNSMEHKVLEKTEVESSKSAPPLSIPSPDTVSAPKTGNSTLSNASKNTEKSIEPTNTSIEALDVTKEIGSVFNSSQFTPAKDAASIKSGGSSNMLPKSRTFSANIFKFDTSFGKPTQQKTFTLNTANDFPLDAAFAPNKADLDSAFGQVKASAPTQAFGGFDSDPFASVDFANAFAPQAPVNTTTSSSKSNKTNSPNEPQLPEVSQIMAMGFTKGIKY